VHNPFSLFYVSIKSTACERQGAQNQGYADLPWVDQTAERPTARLATGAGLVEVEVEVEVEVDANVNVNV